MVDYEVQVALEKAFKALEDFKGKVSITFDRGTILIDETHVQNSIDLKEEIDRLEEENDELTEQNDRLEEKVEDLKDEINDYKRRFRTIEEAVNDY